MEIERKFKVKSMPHSLEQYPRKEIEQGYLCKNPVVRIRKSNEDYILTYKSKFGVVQSGDCVARMNQEVEVPLGEEGYYHLRDKVDHYFIEKNRYIIPLEGGLKAELDVFEGNLKGLIFVEVEFPDEESARNFRLPEWFGEDVSFDKRYSNSFLSRVKNLDEIGL